MARKGLQGNVKMLTNIILSSAVFVLFIVNVFLTQFGTLLNQIFTFAIAFFLIFRGSFAVIKAITSRTGRANTEGVLNFFTAVFGYLILYIAVLNVVPQLNLLSIAFIVNLSKTIIGIGAVLGLIQSFIKPRK